MSLSNQSWGVKWLWQCKYVCNIQELLETIPRLIEQCECESVTLLTGRTVTFHIVIVLNQVFKTLI